MCIHITYIKYVQLYTLHFIFVLNLFTDLKSRKTERKYLTITAQIHTTAKAGPGQSQEPGPNPRLLQGDKDTTAEP